MPAVSRGAPSTLTQPLGSQTRVSILARAALSARQVFFTSADLQKPDRLYQVVHAIQQNLATVLRILGSAAIFSGVRIAGQVFAGGQTILIAHGLGRPYQGFFPIRSQGNAPVIAETALPPGVTPTMAISLISANPGTYDFWIY